jgi:hypothetical protein
MRDLVHPGGESDALFTCKGSSTLFALCRSMRSAASARAVAADVSDDS